MQMFGSAEEEGTTHKDSKKNLMRIFVEEISSGAVLAAMLVRGGPQAGSPCGSQFRIHRFSAISNKISSKR
jgi:hypothetical protein